MSAGGKRAIVILGLILASSLISWGLTTIEAALAPIPSHMNGEALDASLDALEASITRWQLIYIPLIGLVVVLGVALLLDGRLAWLEAIVASAFVIARIVMTQSTTASWANAFMWVVVYCVVGGVVAQILRGWKTRKAS
jgi:hypothetical protein